MGTPRRSGTAPEGSALPEQRGRARAREARPRRAPRRVGGSILCIGLTIAGLAGCTPPADADTHRVAIAGSIDRDLGDISATGTLAWSERTGCLVLRNSDSEIVVAVDRNPENPGYVALPDGSVIAIGDQVEIEGAYLDPDHLLTGAECVVAGTEPFAALSGETR